MATSLHQQLKFHYVADESQHEIDLEGFRIDAIDEDGRLIEVQCASLLAIRDKIRKLTKKHKVVVVKPLPARKKLLKKNRKDGKIISSRYSPARHTFPYIFLELVHFTKAFPNANLQLDVVMTEQEEIRVPAKRSTWRRKHTVLDRRLVEVQRTHSLKTADDLWKELGLEIPEVFTTSDLASAGKFPRWLAQKAAWCFREMKHIEVCGKRGNALEYRLCKTQGKRKKHAA